MDIQVQDLELSFKDFTLKIKYWSLPSQSHVLIEGPSGAGKTTFLHLLSGLIPHSQGQILVGSQNISSMTREKAAQFRRKNFGIVFQKIHLLPHLNVMENISIGNCENGSENGAQLISYLGLQNRQTHLPNALSQGETQRAAVARAIISAPKVIFADEPTSGLDDDNCQKVISLITEKNRHATVVVVSHDHRIRDSFKNRIDFREIVQP